jgi:ribose transport system ATP-binding protein
MTNNAIDAVGLNISFDGVNVLTDVDFFLKTGEVHAVIGQNGAGKSTLMKILNGFYQKDSGEFTVLGKPGDFPTTRAAQEAGVAMVYQDFSLIPTLSVADNIFLVKPPGKRKLFINNQFSIDEAKGILEMIGLGNNFDPRDLVEEISIGQQQLVEIAKALALDSKILILDEPTASLSNTEIKVLFKVIRTLKQKGISIVYITHYLKDIFQVCDTVTVLRDGKSVFCKSVSETSVKQLVNEMLGKRIDQKQNWKQSQYSAVGDAPPPLLELRDVTTEHISNISLKIHSGEIIGLAGLLGSGRTEILRAIYGLDKILSGQFHCDNQTILIRSPAEAIAKGISLVPEDRRIQGLILDFSVEDNILLPVLKKIKQTFLLNWRHGKKIVSYFLKHLNVKASGGEQIVRFLSGGNQQKIVIAKCLSNNPKIVLLDDPTFGIDQYSKYEIMDIVKKYVLKGNCAVFVSSEYSEIANFCDRIYVVKKGHITNCIQKNNVTEDDLLQIVQ